MTALAAAILRIVASEYGLSETALLAAADRTRAGYEPRAVAMALLSKHCALSQTELAKLFNRADHTSAGYALTRAEAFLQVSYSAIQCETRVNALLSRLAPLSASRPGHGWAQSRRQRAVQRRDYGSH